ncbi:ubiquitin carboxyl-terminal hydrolase 47-like [Xyrichtys novacula]|uniref:Ubiquitin carboxyl-terminal hydrolase 47-like n=1 Tax=Xyrichtys novacula TaxID=13765 RepID=A0AAV1HJB7_XYRNO|nr:ubiquitin carboxyl-terminal hydrolase 47-like [Xyrichtys novacula]
MNHNKFRKFKQKLLSSNISDYHGLISPGLTCYLNTVLQVLFMTEDFREAVKRCSSEDLTTFDSHLADLFTTLEKETAKTHEITRQLGVTNVYEQRDAAEYLEKILCRASPEAAKIFKGELNHRSKCLTCEDTNETINSFWILPLVVQDSCGQLFTVGRGLEAFFRGEKFSGANEIFCNHCNKKREADLGCEITHNPEILTLLLKRFSFDSKHKRYFKLDCEVEVPETLHMTNCNYDLYALVDHNGDLTEGHYTARIKSFETQGWYHFNDRIVKSVRHALFGMEGERLKSRRAYLLMYRKVNKHPGKCGDAYSATSHIDAKERHKDEHTAEGNFKHLNGETSIKRLDVVAKKQTNILGSLEKTVYQEAPHREKIQRDGGQQWDKLNRQQPDTNSVDHMQHLNTRGTTTASLRTHQVQHAETKDVKNKAEGDISHRVITTKTVTEVEKRSRDAARHRHRDRDQREPWRF